MIGASAAAADEAQTDRKTPRAAAHHDGSAKRRSSGRRSKRETASHIHKASSPISRCVPAAQSWRSPSAKGGDRVQLTRKRRRCRCGAGEARRRQRGRDPRRRRPRPKSVLLRPSAPSRGAALGFGAYNAMQVSKPLSTPDENCPVDRGVQHGGSAARELHGPSPRRSQAPTPKA